MKTETLFDVVIYEIDSRRVDTIAGKNLRESGSFHTADKRLDTVLPRLNDQYSAAIVPAGKYSVGSVIAETDM